VAGNVPEVPGGAPTIVGLIGTALAVVGTYLGTRYTTRATAQQSLEGVVNARIERIFTQHAADLADRDREIAYLRDRMADMETKYALCEARTHQLQLEVQRLKDRIERPWDGRTERRREE
jgi:hypothetical protein